MWLAAKFSACSGQREGHADHVHHCHFVVLTHYNNNTTTTVAFA
jgi:hypothetical protein